LPLDEIEELLPMPTPDEGQHRYTGRDWATRALTGHSAGTWARRRRCCRRLAGQRGPRRRRSSGRERSGGRHRWSILSVPDKGNNGSIDFHLFDVGFNRSACRLPAIPTIQQIICALQRFPHTTKITPYNAREKMCSEWEVRECKEARRLGAKR